MFGRMLTKEFRLVLADRRFVVALAFCCLLSAIGVSVGIGHHRRDRLEYERQTALRERGLQEWVERDCLSCLRDAGLGWHRPPQALRPVVAGISDAVGRLGMVRRGPPQFFLHHEPNFQESLLEQNPAMALFQVLDLSGIVTIVLSLLALMFTHNSFCDEKEQGTLSLCASFPVSRSQMAAAKLMGTSLAILVPFVLSFLLGASILALSSEIALTPGEWARLGLIGSAFAVFILVFSAFGLLVSALTHRRASALLVLLGLWSVWVFLLPSLAVRWARDLRPAAAVHEIDRAVERIRWEVADGAYDDREAAFHELLPDSVRHPGPNGNALWWWDHRFDAPIVRIDAAWRDRQEARIEALIDRRRNDRAAQVALAEALGLASPVGALKSLVADLAGTGWQRQAKIEAAFHRFHGYYLDYIANRELARAAGGQESSVLADFVPFTPPADTPAVDVLRAHTHHLLALLLFILVGYTAAYVAMIRYDVR